MPQSASPLPGTPRDLNTHTAFRPPSDLSEWEARRKQLRIQILAAAGIYPLPKKTPLNARLGGKRVFSDYSVENVAIETLPGFYLCGNLYRPVGRKGPHPGIVNPHGHWQNGRLEMQPDVPRTDPKGPRGEGRGNLVSIGVNLARQGFVVFAYDMVGYNETSQVGHGFAGTLAAWRAGATLFGLQTWNSIRATDFLESLPDVDRKRIGCTGASGGGTQTFILAAVDDRIRVSVPVNMVSANMQGGCLCENGPGLRLGTDNVEIAALFAPKPQLLVSCTGDWTSNNLNEEFPLVREVYELYGAQAKTECVQFNYGHNYNVESREAMYAFFGKWLMGERDASQFREKPVTADVATMRPFNASSPMPATALKEGPLLASLKRRAEEALGDWWPSKSGDVPGFRAAMRPALWAALGQPGLPGESEASGTAKRAVVTAMAKDRGRAQSLAAQLGNALPTELVILNSPRLDEQGLWRAFYSCYNRSPLGEDVLDIRLRLNGEGAVALIALGDAAEPALFARAITPEVVSAVVEGPGLRAAGSAFAPGIEALGGLRTALALGAARQIFVAGSKEVPLPEEWVRDLKRLGARIEASDAPVTAELVLREIGSR